MGIKLKFIMKSIGKSIGNGCAVFQYGVEWLGLFKEVLHMIKGDKTKKKLKGGISMSKSKWKQLAKISGGAILILTLFTAGCVDTGKLQYNTNCDQQKLIELEDKTLVILSYEYDELILGADHLEPSVAQIVADHQKAKFLSEFGSLFKVKDVSNNFSVLKGRKPSIDNPELVSEILQEIDADGGILITNAYGYGMGGSVLQKILEAILPKKWVRVVFGPSIIEGYYFASNTYIVDKEGNTIWNFYGKVSSSPKVLESVKPEEFARSVIGLDPSQQRLVKAMMSITDHYTEYIKWLMQADIDKSPNKNYFTDYPEEKRDRYIGVYPASDRSHVPHVSSAPAQ